MCGITGIFNIEGADRISIQMLNRMNRVIRHRGPDESGIFLDDRVGMGSMRLSIIDLQNGTQPIHNEDKNLWIVYNGEIYNFRELRQDLCKAGHQFYTATDTEVILHLYEQYGPDCLHRLNGQFAFAIWDIRKKELFLARDRVGIRPLHYAMKNGMLYFASEIKSLFASGKFDGRIDPFALDQIFTFWTTLPNRTAFEGIHELAPGHWMRISEERFDILKYWDFPLLHRSEHLDLTPSEICEQVRPLLLDAVKIRLIADVPVGSYLSGGLDSSGITAIVARHFNRNVETFGLRFEETAFDESTHQTHMADYLHVAHQELRVSNGDIADGFEKTIWHGEKPILRTAPVPMLLLSRIVSDAGLKVVLTGEGADEVFGGYDIFKEALIRRFWARQPASKIRPELITTIYPDIFRNNSLKQSVINFFRQGIDAPEDPLFSHLIRWNNTRRIKTFFSEDIKQQLGNYNGLEELRGMLPSDFDHCDCLSKAQYLESRLFLSNYLLSSQGDRPAMAHSVESRMPYLDYRIIELLGQIPSTWKILGLNEKYILKKALSGLLPESILSRRKNPYRAPIHQSLTAGRGRQIIADFLNEPAIRTSGYFDFKKTEKLLNKLDSNRNFSEVDAMALAGILSTQILHSQFVAQSKSDWHSDPAPGLVVDYRKSLPN